MAATSETLLNRNTTVVHLPVKVPASNAPDFTDVPAANIDRLKSPIAHSNAVVASHQSMHPAAAAVPIDVDQHATMVMAGVTTTKSAALSLSSAPSAANNVEMPDAVSKIW